MTIYIGRREFIGAFGAAVTWPFGALAEVSAKKHTLIGWLSGAPSKVAGFTTDVFLDGMRDLGYVNGRDFDMVSRYAEGFGDRLPALAEEIGFGTHRRPSFRLFARRLLTPSISV